MEDKNLINDYCKEVANEFVNKYLKELDDNIYKMLNAFGFEGDVNDAGQWLKEKRYNLMIDEDNYDDNTKVKSIYLVNMNTNEAISLVMIRTWIEDGNLCYAFSDVFINRINEGE